MSFWPRISVVIIALDAEQLLPAALESIPEAAEVIVADGKSKDRTVEIAKKYGVRVMEQNFALIEKSGGNFDVARNDAANYAKREWVLFLDADERLTPELKEEIGALEPNKPPGYTHRENVEAFDFPRLNLFWSKPVRLLGEDRQIRLVQKGKGQYSGKALHQKLIVQGRIGHLHSPLIHENFRSWKDVHLRFKRYLPVEAKNSPKRAGLKQVVSTPYYMFRYYYLHNGAWRDGLLGLLVCLIYSAYHGSVAWASRRRSHA